MHKAYLEKSKKITHVCFMQFSHVVSMWYVPMSYIAYNDAGTGTWGWGALPPSQFLADHLTLFKPGGQILPTLYY